MHNVAIGTLRQSGPHLPPYWSLSTLCLCIGFMCWTHTHTHTPCMSLTTPISCFILSVRLRIMFPGQLMSLPWPECISSEFTSCLLSTCCPPPSQVLIWCLRSAHMLSHSPQVEGKKAAKLISQSFFIVCFYFSFTLEYQRNVLFVLGISGGVKKKKNLIHTFSLVFF